MAGDRLGLVRTIHGLCLLFVCGVAGRAQTTVVTAPSPVEGVEVVGPEAAGFQELVTQLVPDSEIRSALERVLPYSMVVRNRTSRTIVFYVARYEFPSPTGRSGADVRAYDYRTNEPKLTPGASRLLMPTPGLTQAVQQGQLSARGAGGTDDEVLGRLAASPRVTVSLDAVMFDNGEFAGPDASSTFIKLSNRGAGDMAMLVELERMGSQPDEEVIARLEQMIEGSSKGGQGDPLERLRRHVQASALKGLLVNRGRTAYQKALLNWKISAENTIRPWR